MAEPKDSRVALGVTRENLRQHNLGVVLSVLHAEGAVPRSRLTTVSGLNRSTISDLVGELATLGLVCESEGLMDGTIGRPSHMVEPSSDVVAIAVNTDTDATTVGAVTLDGRVVQTVRRFTRRQSDPHAAVALVVELIAELRAKMRPDVRIAGVGVAVPGQIRVADGVVRNAPHLTWVEVPLARMLRDATGLNVSIANDGACVCTAEHQFGAGRDSTHIVLLYAGYGGIGGGAVIDGRLLHGSTGYAGEFGHVQITSDKAADYSGLRGTLEGLVRRDDLLEVFRLDAATDEELDFEILTTKDGRAIRLLHRQAEVLGRTIGALATVFNPDTVILGGFLTSLRKFDNGGLLAGLHASSLTASHERLTITECALGSSAVLVGAAELAFAPLLDNPAGVSLMTNRPEAVAFAPA